MMSRRRSVRSPIREIAPKVAIVSLVEEQDSIDILELSGATSVLPLKHQLGAYLANRIDVGQPEAHVVGEFGRLQIADIIVAKAVPDGAKQDIALWTG